MRGFQLPIANEEMTTSLRPTRGVAPPDPESSTVDLRTRLYTLWRHRALILCCALVGGLVAVAVSLLASRVYETHAALAISRSKIGEGLNEQEPMATANFRPLIESRALASDVIKETGLDKAPYLLSPSEFYGEVIEIEEVRNSTVILVKGRLRDAQLIANVVNRVAELAVDMARRVNQQEALQARNDIKLQLDEAKARLDQASNNLERFRVSSQLDLVQRDVDSALEQRGGLLDLLINIESERAALARAEQELASRSRVDTVRRSIDTDPALLEAARRADGGSAEILGLQTKNEEVNPVYEDLDKRIADIRTRVAGMEKQKTQMEARKLAGTQLPQLSDMYQKESELSRLEMERDLAKKVYEQVATSYETARLLVAGRSSGLQIISRAAVPDRPESRKLSRNLLIGVFSGLLLACVLVLIRESFATLPRLSASRP